MSSFIHSPEQALINTDQVRRVIPDFTENNVVVAVKYSRDDIDVYHFDSADHDTSVENALKFIKAITGLAKINL